MSLILNLGTKLAGLEVKTYGFGSLGNTVYLGKYEISLQDFLMVAAYVLTNTDLEPNDPRTQFVKCVQSINEVDGYNPKAKRLKLTISPVLPNEPR